MSGKRTIMINTMLLTMSSLAIRIVGMIFQAWLASHIGAAGIGLYQLTGSITVLFSVFAVSGVRFAATRLVSEEMTSQPCCIREAMRRCIIYALLFGVLSFVILYSAAVPIGFLWVGDARVVLSLRLAALAFPFLALSAAFTGYFTACSQIRKIVSVQLLSSASNIAAVVYFLKHTDLLNLERTCAAITAGSVIAEIVGAAFLTAFYRADRRNWVKAVHTHSHLTKRLLAAALPLAFSSYARTALNTLEHVLIPSKLQKAGLSAESALAGYGAVHGMALPAVLFPACLLFSLSELIIPELTKEQVQGNHKRICHIVRRCRAGTILYALITAFVIYLLANPIAETVFHTPECAQHIRALAPLMIVMNLDTITDGCLRGLGQQQLVMAINILDAALGVVLVSILLPCFGLTGYLQMIWITESVNCILSTLTLNHVLEKEKASGR